MRDLLFLAHRIPFPPDKGDKIRSWNILSYLARHYRIHLGCFADDPEDLAHVAAMRKLCADVSVVALSRPLALARSLPSLLGDAPMSVRYFDDARMRAWVKGKLQLPDLAGVFVYSSAMAHYVDGSVFPAGRAVVDFVDVDSDKWRQYAERKGWPMRAIYAREARTLAAFERAAATNAAVALFVSEGEAALFRARAPDVAARVRTIENGVDHAFFDPAIRHPDPYPEDVRPIVFTGRMDYWANIDSVTWFARDILPRVRGRAPSAGFWIVGSHPAKEVRALGVLPGVVVTGRVPDVRPYLAHAAVVVAPLRVARGVPNKVLEAMAMAKLVVATGLAVSGIRAEPGTDVVVAEGSEAFADAVVRALGDGVAAPIGARARARILADYDWNKNLAALHSIIEAAA